MPELPRTIQIGAKVYRVSNEPARRTEKLRTGHVWLHPQNHAGKPFQAEWPIRLFSGTTYIENPKPSQA